MSSGSQIETWTQFSHRVGKSVWTLKRWAKDGRIKTVIICGRRHIDVSSSLTMLGLDKVDQAA
jgi:predicted site-specific integrase-resolvase